MVAVPAGPPGSLDEFPHKKTRATDAARGDINGLGNL